MLEIEQQFELGTEQGLGIDMVMTEEAFVEGEIQEEVD